jgi:hypothetical protein
LASHSNAANLALSSFIYAPNDEVHLDLKDDGLIVPDVTAGDGIFSQYLFDLFQTGFYATEYTLMATASKDGGDSELLLRHWVGPSFYVSVPIENSGEDRIPPSRITDLRVKTYDGSVSSRPDLISLIWTAPGDNLNDGTGARI